MDNIYVDTRSWLAGGLAGWLAVLPRSELIRYSISSIALEWAAMALGRHVTRGTVPGWARLGGPVPHLVASASIRASRARGGRLLASSAAPAAAAALLALNM
jgi:hypothetical protein